MGGGSDSPHERILIILPGPEPTEAIERLRKRYANIQWIKYIDTQVEEDPSSSTIPDGWSFAPPLRVFPLRLSTPLPNPQSPLVSKLSNTSARSLRGYHEPGHVQQLAFLRRRRPAPVSDPLRQRGDQPHRPPPHLHSQHHPAHHVLGHTWASDCRMGHHDLAERLAQLCTVA